jgi:hypothetical protein
MKLTDVLTAAQGGTLTYSLVAQLLADQPTRGEESHAHMHTLDPFKSDTSKIKPESFKCPPELVASGLVKMRKLFWENPELHLHPEADYASMKSLKGTKAAVVTDGAPATGYKPYDFYVDKTRLADNDTYLKRGMAAIPEKNENTYSQTLVYKMPGAAKNTGGTNKIATPADRLTAPVGATVVRDEVVTKQVKIHGQFMAMEAHSMFEDSEALVMCTAAVLASDAGIKGLKAMKDRVPGDSYVAIYSATAVTAVKAAYTKNAAANPLKMVERSPSSVEVDMTTKQPKAKGGGSYLRSDVKRVVLVLKPEATGNLVIVTCYPTASDGQIPALPPALPPPTADDDVVEVDKNANVFKIVKQKTPLDLKW